jgi:hypothetical protein
MSLLKIPLLLTVAVCHHFMLTQPNPPAGEPGDKKITVLPERIFKMAFPVMRYMKVGHQSLSLLFRDD